ncbi:retrovirus-related pol polyprotein from transposon TNT 1-94 [Tanacetum coccineum]
MDSDKYLEGQSMQRPPLFESDHFIYWKNRFETYVKAKDLDLWHIILNGDFPPVAKNEVTQVLEVVPFEEQSDDLKKKLAKNNEAKMVLYNALPKKEYERIFMCKMAKDIWQSLLITHQGNSQVKDNKIDLLVQQYEKFTILEEESIDSGFARFNNIITSLKALDEESKDLSSLALDELIGNLKVHEVVMEKDSEIYRGKKERVKSIALKAKKESSDDETLTSGSDDEEYAMAVRNFKKFFRRKVKFVRQPREEKKSFRKRDEKKGKSDRKCFRCGDPNHLIGDCLKPSRNKDQKAFIGGSWSDSNDETCLMAQSSNECCILNIKDYLTKFDPKSYECVFLGYSQNSKAYVVLNKHTIKVEESLNVTFDESPPPTKLSPLVDDDVGEEEAIKKNTKVVNNNNEEDESIEVDEIVNIKESKNHPLDQVIGNLNQRTLRSQAQNHSNFFCFISTIEPKDVKEALKDESWVVAMQEELNQFVANDVWELVPLPISQSVIGTKWVFRNKLDENGIVSRNKARLVAQGYNQQEGIDYDETYAPVARLESIRILLAIACANDFKLYQMDVKSAFLNGFINEEVYVAQPPGFIDFQKPNYVYKLKKALYGLKQAPKAWYDRLKAFLIKHKYSMGMVDNTLFTKKSKSHLIIVQIYVDDIIFGSTSQNLCDDFAKIMHDEFEMSMMGELNFFLGLQIKQMEDRIFFNQSKYIKEMLKKFGLEDSKPTKTPMSTEIKLTKDDEADSVDSSKYQGMIGSLLYLTASRHDIMFSVCLCACFKENPKTTHLEVVNCIFRYIRGTSHLGLWYPKRTRIEIVVYADSDNAGIEPFLTLNETICPRFVVEFYHSLEVKRNEEDIPYIEFKLGQFTFTLTPSRLSQILKTPHALETFYTSEWSLNSLDDHPNSNYFGPKHDIVKKAITTPRTTQAQLLRDPNKLYIDDIRPDLKGWELFFKENFFCSIDKRNKVKACTAYMLYYLTIRRKFNLTSMIIYRMEEVIKKRKGPMPFDMLLTRLYNHILAANPQVIVPIARFTFHEHVMDPLDISRNPSTEKGKKITSPPVTPSSSSSSDDNEAPSFLEFYDELSVSEDLTKAQREKR